MRLVWEHLPTPQPTSPGLIDCTFIPTIHAGCIVNCPIYKSISYPGYSYNNESLKMPTDWLSHISFFIFHIFSYFIFYPHFLARQNAPAAILSSIESVYVLSNPFPSKPSIVFSPQKPFYSQPNYSSWWLGIFWCLFQAI